MSHKKYPLSADTVAGMTVSEYIDFQDFDAETVFCFTPAGIREALVRDRELGKVLKDELGAMCLNDKSEVLYERRGFAVPMTDAVWAQKMRAIGWAALFDYPSWYDADEENDAEIEAQRVARSAIKCAAERERMAVALAANLAKNAKVERAVVRAGPDSIEISDGYQAKGDNGAVQMPRSKVESVIAPLDLYLSDLRPGQGQIARMLVGCAGITTAPTNQLRRYWTEKGMRQIERVSGYKHGSVILKYYGEELRLNDIEVWLKILQLVADQPLGTAVTFNTRQFVRALGKGIGTNSLKGVKSVLIRLKAATFFIETTCPHFIDNLKKYFPDVDAIKNATSQVAITFNMLAEYIDADNGKEFSVTLGRAVRALMGNRVSFWFDEALYYSLRGEYAKRLYLLYTSHKACYPLTRREIREYFGCSMQDDDNLHTELRKALDQLADKGVIEKKWAYMMHPERGMSYVVNKVRAEVPMVQPEEVAT
jgi:hypothetical protein